MRTSLHRAESGNTCSGLDSNWTCPAEATILPMASCLQQSSSDAISSTKSFQRVLQKDCSVAASVKGSYGGFSAKASFSGSKAMASMKEKITKDKITSFQSKAVCVDYVASLKLGISSVALDVLPDFAAAVNELPLSYSSCFQLDSVGGQCPQRVDNGFGDLPPVRTGTRRLQTLDDDDDDDTVNDCACDSSVVRFFRFIQLYGTHYTTRVEMGGKIIRRVEIKESDVQTLQSKKVDIAYGASMKASYKSMFGSASVSASVNGASSDATKSYNDVMSVAKKEININIGGSPNEDWRLWAATTTADPMPIRYRLSPLVELVNRVDTRRGPLFEQAVADYIAAYGKTLSFDTVTQATVAFVEVQYSLNVGKITSATFRVMIGNKGDMLPATVTVTSATGSFRVAVPAKLQISFDGFQGNVPVTLEFVSGVFTPNKMLMEAKKAQHHYHHPHWAHMEAEMAMKKKKKKAPVVASSATSAYFNTIQPFAVMSDNTVLPLDDQYAGLLLNTGTLVPINPLA
jgi:hypothetical protein